MAPEVQLALINNLPTILTALVSTGGAIAAFFGWRKSNANHVAIKENDVRTEDVGKAVNGRMTAFIEEMKKANAETMAEAVKAARLDAEKIALAAITDLKVQIAQAKSDKDILAALGHVEAKLINLTNPAE